MVNFIKVLFLVVCFFVHVFSVYVIVKRNDL